MRWHARPTDLDLNAARVLSSFSARGRRVVRTQGAQTVKVDPVISDGERERILREFGLSEYGARAYLALLDAGEAEAREISRAARVPLAKVYQVMDALQARGLCEILLTTPKRFVPVPFGEFLERVKREHERSIEALASRRPDLERLLSGKGGTRITDRGRVQFVTGRSAVLETEMRMLERATSSVVMVCSPGRALRMRKASSQFERLKERGVAMTFLAPTTAAWGEDHAFYARYGEVRVRAFEEDPRGDSVAFVVVDRAEALVIDSIPDNDRLHEGHDVATYFNEGGLVSALRDLVLAQWGNAPAMPPEGIRVRDYARR